MTEPSVVVQTPFDDMSDLANAFAPRVDEQHLVLPSQTPVNPGETARFSVVLADGSIAMSGTGTCSDCIDNGEGVEPDRYDVVLSALALDPGISDVVFERMLMAREHAHSESPPVESERPLDVDQSEVTLAEAQDEPEALASSTTVIASFDAHAYDREAAREDAGDAEPAPHSLLSRPILAPTWVPDRDIERPASRAQNAVFAYGDEGLPVPPVAPRPEGGTRIDPAPRPA